jgi:hypothetical protein
MRFLWTLLKVALALALVIPISIVVLATALGLFGALVGLSLVALRIAIFCLILWAGFRLFKWAFFGTAPQPSPGETRALPPVDPHYEAAMRELDRELGPSR